MNILSGFERCGVTLICPNGDLTHFFDEKQKQSNCINENFMGSPVRLDLEISGFEDEIRPINDETVEGLGARKVESVSYLFEKLKVGIESISVEVEMPPRKVIKAAKAPNTSAIWTTLQALKNVTVELLSETQPKVEVVRKEKQQYYKIALSVKEEQRKSALDRQESLSVREQQSRVFTSLKFNNLKEAKEIEAILADLKRTLVVDAEDKSFLLNITLTLHGLKKNKEQLLNNYNEALYLYANRSTLYINTTCVKDAAYVIPWLRDNNMRFIMEVNKLSLTEAQTMLKNTSFDWQDMRQSKLETFSQLYMRQATPELEIQLLSSRGISILVTFNEKLPIPYKTLQGLCAIAVLQGKICTLIFHHILISIICYICPKYFYSRCRHSTHRNWVRGHGGIFSNDRGNF